MFKNNYLILKNYEETKSHKIAHIRPGNTKLSKLQNAKIKSNDIIHLNWNSFYTFLVSFYQYCSQLLESDYACK